MSYVNIHGVPIDLKGLGTKKREKSTRFRQAEHKGFRVVGISPEDVAAARRDYERAQERRNLGGEPGRFASFDVDAWARNAKTQKVGKKPFATEDGAKAAIALAEKSGWLRVRMEPVVSGV